MVQILFTVFGMGYIYENAQIIDNHGTLLHTTVVQGKMFDKLKWLLILKAFKDVCQNTVLSLVKPSALRNP